MIVMITIIKNYIQCDECNTHLSYDEEDTYISWNWNHQYRVLYVDCPKCDNSIPIKRIKQ